MNKVQICVTRVQYLVTLQNHSELLSDVIRHMTDFVYQILSKYESRLQQSYQCHSRLPQIIVAVLTQDFPQNFLQCIHNIQIIHMSVCMSKYSKFALSACQANYPHINAQISVILITYQSHYISIYPYFNQTSHILDNYLHVNSATRSQTRPSD